MKMKHLYSLAVLLLLLVGFQSCVEEDGPGVPEPKSVAIEADEYTVDTTDPETPLFFAFRWVDVGNATYKVALSTAGSSVAQELDNEVTAEELNVLSMVVTNTQLLSFLTEAGHTAAGTYDITISITATPIDPTLPTALAEEGSVKSSVIHVTR